MLLLYYNIMVLAEFPEHNARVLLLLLLLL